MQTINQSRLRCLADVRLKPRFQFPQQASLDNAIDTLSESPSDSNLSVNAHTNPEVLGSDDTFILSNQSQSLVEPGVVVDDIARPPSLLIRIRLHPSWPAHFACRESTQPEKRGLVALANNDSMFSDVAFGCKIICALRYGAFVLLGPLIHVRLEYTWRSMSGDDREQSELQIWHDGFLDAVSSDSLPCSLGSCKDSLTSVLRSRIDVRIT